MANKNKHIGSSFEDIFTEAGELEEIQAVAIKRVITWQIEKEMKEKKISKTTMASLMETSRSSLDRLLDPNNPSATLLSLVKAAKVLRKELHIELA